MKKLKIRAKELRRIGFEDQKLIRLACTLAENNYRRDEKPVVMGLLEEILIDPEKFAGHEYFASLAAALSEKSKTAAKPSPEMFRLKPGTEDFVIYGRSQIDKETLHQMYTAMKLPIAVKGALMADAHLGYGLPIGGVLAAYNAVMPYGVGMDIGCRMCMSVFPDPPKIIETKRELLINMLIDNTRFGLAEFKDIGQHELMERREFREIPFLKSLQKKFYEQLGTSGHGNHFVDVGYLVVDEYSGDLGLDPGEYFAVLSHSGSRNFGSEIAKYYTALAQKKLGLTGEGAKLAWLDLDTEEGQEYWQAMTLAGDYSAANHQIIHQKLSKALGSSPLKVVENHHNFAWKEKLPDGRSLIIHRKGATPAGTGDTGIIPGNMVSPAFVVSGKGNENSLNSASHGAGRLLSRRKAKSTLSMDKLKKVLKKHNVELIGGAPDESPAVYKDIHQVMEAQKDLVNVLAKFYPKIVRME
jgi:tRNA-splicing ligase RtcB (3'-phosphate/5'-hydroxy nucleic acid ligase)